MDKHECEKEYEWGQLNGHMKSIDETLKEIKDELKCHRKLLNRRPVIDKIWSGATGFIGGFVAVIAKMKLWP
jgi:hypothetical protein